ncbi:MAG: helix-turn-helix transcriptional regulator [Gemmiger sp.]
MKFSQFQEPRFFVVVRTMMQTRGFPFLFLVLLVPLFLTPAASRMIDSQVEERVAEELQQTLTHQSSSLVTTLDAMASLLSSSTANPHYIDVGRTAAPDTDLEAGLACAELSHVAELHRYVTSAYLVCNLNHTIYNSLDSNGYKDDEFYDLSWRQQYFSSKGGLQLLDTPRAIRTPSRPGEMYISMVSRVPYFSTLQNKFLVFNLSLEDLTGTLVFPAENSATPSRLWIYNSQNELLWSQDSGIAPASLQELGLPAEDGALWRTADLGGIPYLLVSTALLDYNWVLVEALPYSCVQQRSGRHRRILFSALGLSALAAFFYLFGYTYHRQLQILRTGQQVYLETRQDMLDRETGLAYLQRICLEKSRALERDSQILDTFAPVLERDVVLSLIHGDPMRRSDREAYRQVMERMGLLTGTARRYVVLLAHVEAITALKMNLHQDVYSRFRRVLQYSCNEQLAEDFQASYAWIDHATMVGILHFPAQLSEKQQKLALDQMGQSIQKQLTLLSEQPVMAAFGDVMEDPWHLVESYEHAKQLIQHKTYYCKERPFTYQDMVEADTRMSYDRRKQLVDQIKLGKGQEAGALLQNYFSILHANPYIGLEQVQEICVDLAGTVQSALGDQERSLEPRFADVALVKQQIRQLTTVHEAADCLIEYAQAVADVMLEQMQHKKDIRVQDILEWIENNYNRDISLDDIAAQMDLSPTYASKQIKAYTGQSVVNYINEVRINHAKELLANTKMSSNEIGVRVGFRYSQSFIRAFRKTVGMTPGNYRSLHAHSAPAQEDPTPQTPVQT